MMTRHLILILIPLLFATSSFADQRILDIEGADGAVTLVRAGQAVPLLPFASLQVGDEIRVLKAGTHVLIGGAGRTIRIDETNSPYRVAETQAPTVARNVWAGVIKSYRILVGDDKEVVTIITRGDPATAPQFICLAPTENLIPEGVAIRAFWTNGRTPFRLTLSGPEGGADPVEAGMEAVESPALFTAPSLPQGTYRIAIADGARVQSRYPAKFQVVPHAALPEQARALLNGDLPPRAKDRLVAAALAGEVAWRYAALLYAARAQDAALLAGLLARNCR
jgi:hypothetical protein